MRVYDESVLSIVRAANATIRPRQNLFASMCQLLNHKDHQGSSTSAVNVEECFVWFFRERFALWGAVVSVDYESGKWQGRSVSRRYQNKFLVKLNVAIFFWPERRGKQTIDGWICFVINGLVRLLDLLIVDVLLNYWIREAIAKTFRVEYVSMS